MEAGPSSEHSLTECGSSNLAAPSKLSKTVLTFLRCILGAVFVYAGVIKMLNPDGFIADLGRFQIMPDLWVAPIAIFLPILETVIGAALLMRIFYAGALLLSKLLLVLFSIALIFAWLRGFDINCGCFGNGLGDPSVPWALAKNAVLLCICLTLIGAMLKNRPPKVIVSINPS